MRTGKVEFEEILEGNDFNCRLESSHDITIKFARHLEERFVAMQKLFGKLQSLLESCIQPLTHRPNGLEELELIRFKDLSRFKEMEMIELRLLEHFSSKFANKESDFLVLIERVKDKLSHYDQSLRSLEEQLDIIRLQNHQKESELSGKVQELSARAELHRSELESMKSFQITNFESTDRLKDEKLSLTFQINHLKNTIEEMNRAEKQVNEKHAAEICKFLFEIETNKKNLRIFAEQAGNFEASQKRLHEILTAIQEVTHAVFLKYGLSQSEWQDSHWKEELETYNEEFGDTLVEIEFLCFMIAKLTSDNNWLVDRLSEFGKAQRVAEPRSTAQGKLKTDVINDLKAASNALKEFEEARDKLLSQFDT
jgi:hypothetical protein